MLGENRVTPLIVKELSLADVQAFPVSTLCINLKTVAIWLDRNLNACTKHYRVLTKHSPHGMCMFEGGYNIVVNASMYT